MNLAITIERKRIIKASKVLDMLEQLDPMIDDVSEKLSLWDSIPSDAPLKLFSTKHELKEKLKTYSKMQERLWMYYAKTLEA